MQVQLTFNFADDTALPEAEKLLASLRRLMGEQDPAVEPEAEPEAEAEAEAEPQAEPEAEPEAEAEPTASYEDAKEAFTKLARANLAAAKGLLEAMGVARLSELKARPEAEHPTLFGQVKAEADQAVADLSDAVQAVEG